MARYAAVYTLDGTIGEIRSGDAPPSYVPQGYEWIDVSDSTLSDQQLLGSTWDGTQVVKKVMPPNFDPVYDYGSTIDEILT